VTTIKACAVALSRLAAAFALSLATAAPVHAADWSRPFAPPETYIGDFGLRMWYGRARTAKNLYDTSGALLVSRLSYNDLNIFTGEAYTRFDFSTGWFLKGYIGGGNLFGGRLKDEDFPPTLVPYSATLSDQKEGYLFYGSVDGGFKIIRGGDFHVGAFVGYHFLRDQVSAFGCGQVATNPLVCAGGIPDSIKVITQRNDWHSLRVGLDAAVEFDRRWKLAVDAAWLPYVKLHGADSHWLRIGTSPGNFTGALPEDGKGWGYQLDAFLSYRFNDTFSVGVGGRYWHAETTKGDTHFEGHVVGVNALPQPVRWKQDHFGAFLQTTISFGPTHVIGGG
jgi:hypothetical protein